MEHKCAKSLQLAMMKKGVLAYIFPIFLKLSRWAFIGEVRYNIMHICVYNLYLLHMVVFLAREFELP